MGQKHAQRWCPNCERNVLAVKDAPNHVLHLLLSVITFGVWIVGWAAASLASDWRGWRCSDCGGGCRPARWR